MNNPTPYPREGHLMAAALTCPKCQSFGAREVSVHGYDLHEFSCHDCRHVFYLRAADLQRECDKIRGTVWPRQPKNRPKN